MMGIVVLPAVSWWQRSCEIKDDLTWIAKNHGTWHTMAYSRELDSELCASTGFWTKACKGDLTHTFIFSHVQSTAGKFNNEWSHLCPYRRSKATKSGNRHLSLSDKLKHDCFSAGEEEGKLTFSWGRCGEAVGDCQYLCVLPTPIHVPGECVRKRSSVLVGILLNMKLANLPLGELDNHSSRKLWTIFINQAICLFL